MKRSEMIKNLINTLELIRGVDNGYYVYPDDETFAKILLDKIEEIGYSEWEKE